MAVNQRTEWPDSPHLASSSAPWQSEWKSHILFVSVHNWPGGSGTTSKELFPVKEENVRWLIHHTIRHLLPFFAKVETVFSKKKTEGLPDDKTHSGDNTILSTAIPPYSKSLIAANITIWKNRKFNRERGKEKRQIIALKCCH